MSLLSEARELITFFFRCPWCGSCGHNRGCKAGDWLAAYESRPKMRVKYEVIDDSYRWTWTIGDQVFRFGDTSVADAKRFADLLGLELEVVDDA